MFAEGHGFFLLSHIPVVGHLLPAQVLGSLFVALLFVATMWVARLKLARVTRAPDGGVIPDSKLSYLNFFEIVAERTYGLTESVLGHHDAPRFFPVIGTIFLFIFVQNALGLIPGFLPPTDNLNTTLALGTFVFIYYNYVGLRASGLSYLKHFLGPVLWLSPLMLIIELISHVVRPLSLGLRLRGNMTGDHMVLAVFSELAPYLVPLIFMGLGLFVCFVQAFVFSLLTMVYISLASAHDDH
ncbi:MAG: F0F1 ATP synthase subunit A [Bdellovibrionales bacterium]|nr:F0F1 ATP synthase subunit A [Bdellovibrionales bacterium]